MPPSEYQPLSQEGDDRGFGNSQDAQTTEVGGENPFGSHKPMVYYGEGEFDPPSSDDEEDMLVEKKHGLGGDTEMEGAGLQEDGELYVGGHKNSQRKASVRWLVICLAALVTTAGVIGIFAALSYKGTPYQIHGNEHFNMDHVFNTTFLPHARSLRWVPEAGDGVYATVQDGHIALVDLKTNTTKNLVAMNDVRDGKGASLAWNSWELSSDMKYMLIKSDHLKQWRHSSFGNYYIHDLSTHHTRPLVPPTNPPVTAYAKWSPTGEAIAYVVENDLYVLPSLSSTKAIRVTSSGNASLFHGVPDWVYEEEVFSNDFALWWSPNSAKVAYLRFDETAVDEFTFPVYNPTEDSYTVVPYPGHVTMKYPKPGYPNPLVSVHVFEVDSYHAGLHSGDSESVALDHATLELTWDRRQMTNNSIIAEVSWVGNTSLVLKEVNRAATNGSIVLFELDSGAVNVGQVVRTLGKDGEQGDDGWIEPTQSIYGLPPNLSPDGVAAYLDIVPKDGYQHLALFSPITNSTPQFLTSGAWEVTGDILAVDKQRGLVYFQAANPSSTERHIYSVPTGQGLTAPKSLTDNSSPGYYSASFSPQGGFYLLNYQGPSAPWQRVIQAGNSSFNFVFTENSQLNQTLARYEMPVVLHSTIESDGYELNVREIRPPHMDDSGKTKYPVLFHVYGGPNSQQVTVKYGVDWHHYLATALQYVVVTVDGRGTGFKGRNLRNPVKDDLGHWETIDQINAAKIWASKDYVDTKRIGIWGWSYGGYMSTKVAEAGAGVHSLAMAVAPVTSWRLYDSIYTERYMNLPDLNADGYLKASVSNVSAFHKIDYLFAHGSGDDNVHYANSAHLLDMLTADHVRNFRFRMFTDSDHSIYRRGANREVYEFLVGFLVEKWGKGPRRRGW